MPPSRHIQFSAKASSSPLRFAGRGFAGRFSPERRKAGYAVAYLMDSHPGLLGGKLMRLCRFHLALSVLVFSLLLASSAFAGTVKLTYIQSTGSGIGGGGVYPSAFYINDSTTKTYLLCDSYDNTIQKGETWTATVSPFLQGISTSLFGSGMTLDYKAAGLIFKSMLAGTISNTDGQ